MLYVTIMSCTRFVGYSVVIWCHTKHTRYAGHMSYVIHMLPYTQIVGRYAPVYALLVLALHTDLIPILVRH